MSATYLQAVQLRSLDEPLSPEYASLAASMHPTVRSLLVHNVDPRKVAAPDLLAALRLTGTAHDLARRRCQNGVCDIPEALTTAQCAKLREVVDGARMSAFDSIDGRLEYQLNITAACLATLIGQPTVDRLQQLASEYFAGLWAPLSPEALAEAEAKGIRTAPLLPAEPHEVFVRRYSAATRPWVGFHHDTSSLTLNIALSDDGAHTGGRLLALLDDGLRVCERREGSATMHASRLLHAVTRMGTGTRHSLILFYRQVCPVAAHALVRCGAESMALFYPLSEGSYSCDTCGDGAHELAGCDMWHCAEGCEYDVCHDCHEHSPADGVEYVSVR